MVALILRFLEAYGLMYMCACWNEVGFMDAGYPYAMDYQPAIDMFNRLWGTNGDRK